MSEFPNECTVGEIAQMHCQKQFGDIFPKCSSTFFGGVISDNGFSVFNVNKF